jgi:hypothetical protein
MAINQNSEITTFSLRGYTDGMVKLFDWLIEPNENFLQIQHIIIPKKQHVDHKYHWQSSLKINEYLDNGYLDTWILGTWKIYNNQNKNINIK